MKSARKKPPRQRKPTVTQQLANLQPRLPLAGPRLMSGRWNRRDGAPYYAPQKPHKWGSPV